MALVWISSKFKDVHFNKRTLKLLVAQSCPILCDPMDCNPPGSSVHGILQARILEWVAMTFSRGSSWFRDWTRVSHIAGRFFTIWVTGDASRVWEKWVKCLGRLCPWLVFILSVSLYDASNYPLTKNLLSASHHPGCPLGLRDPGVKKILSTPSRKK